IVNHSSEAGTARSFLHRLQLFHFSIQLFLHAVRCLLFLHLILVQWNSSFHVAYGSAHFRYLRLHRLDSCFLRKNCCFGLFGLPGKCCCFLIHLRSVCLCFLVVLQGLIYRARVQIVVGDHLRGRRGILGSFFFTLLASGVRQRLSI